ncbi:MAG TPA: YhfC family glutamic-type intramembrane protease [Verrucomicrobiae bacterium]|nr:YhfC family glutamic-type intramembrane protease [Verrucomicrobiae bacterium]
MQNIDPVFILQPTIVIIIASALLVYWYSKRRFNPMVLVYSLVAYAVAIVLKYAVQSIPTNIVLNNVELGVYYGLQTVIFEVGLAYLMAWYGVSHGKLEKKDAEAYGAGLAFWENAVLLGILSLINLVAYYSILSTNTPLAQTLYDQLNKNAPGYFAPISQALGTVAYGILERISSILFHSAWGYLCFAAAYLHKKRLFLVALPMGFLDFLVPFEQNLGLPIFEAIVFALAVLSVIVAWYPTKQFRKTTENEPAATHS